MRVKVVKNKVAPPFRVAEMELMHSSGISREGDVLTLAVDDGIVQKKGGWHSYGETSLGNSREKSKETLANNPALMAEISRKVLEKRGLLNPSGQAQENGQLTEETPAPAKLDKADQPAKSRRGASASAE